MSGRSPRSTFGRPVPPPIATTRGTPGRGTVQSTGSAEEDSDRMSAPNLGCRGHERNVALDDGPQLGLNRRKHLVLRALVILREIDLGPGQAARADGVQRPMPRELE